MIKIIIVLLLLYILFNLFRALFVMMSAKEHSKPMSHYLGRRVLFSGVVLIIIIAALKLGLIQTNPSPIHKATARTQIQINTATPHLQSANTKQLLERQSAYHS
ncbi:DUF2909 domain-containing protein [Pseudoalteromonas gelatinilytica]|uniref:DUF2909 domain-containing protein n=1 Tax=Pseudoalteromonas gelatinilytica TaxID=1703256 RepID=A0A3A3ER42_9GAMM|nr:DUF2909 domain-containing protein [Pseudoalteromonas profundi]